MPDHDDDLKSAGPGPLTTAPAALRTVEQKVPLRHPNPGHDPSVDPNAVAAEITVIALCTAADGLVIIPALGTTKDGGVEFMGYSTLTHAATGRSIQHGDSGQLRRLADELARFDWTFTDPGHFSEPENTATLTQIQQAVRDWQGQDFDPWAGKPIRLMGDTDEALPAARAAEPARTMLREDLDTWIKHNEARPKFPADNDEHGIRAWRDHIAIDVYGYGLIYLLAVLQRTAPEVADAAARNLYAAYDGGELGEWVYQWAQELAAGKPMTLHGIPARDALVAESDGGLPVATVTEPTRFPTPGMNFIDLTGRVRGVTDVTDVRNHGAYDDAYRVEYLDGEPEMYGVVGTRTTRN